MTLRIGTLTVDPPVVLAPMAGVTNRAFRLLCREQSPSPTGLYVNEMVTARALVEGNEKTLQMLRFHADERPRSAQLYGTAPGTMAEAVRLLVGEHGVEHVDLNFGCPVPKVTSKGGGAALPVRRRLLADIIAAAVRAAEPVPVTVKFRLGVDDQIRTSLSTGRIAEGEGAAAVALHARTAEQRYAGRADWGAIAELKAAVTTIPVLGNGDIWQPADATAMLAATGCDGVVVGRGCLGRPWLFADLADAFAGRPVPSPRVFSVVAAAMRRHAALLAADDGEDHGLRMFRRHAGWYVTGYAVGADVRRRLGLVATLAGLDAVLDEIDPTLTLPPGSEHLARGHTEGPRPVRLPPGWLDHPDDPTPPVGAELAVSGG